MSKVALATIDIESTGLDPRIDKMLEVAIVLSDKNLNVIAEMSDVIKQPEPLDWETVASDFVIEMHTKNGLRKQIDKGHGRKIGDLEDALRYFLEEHGATGLPMHGSNVANFDRPWLKRYMPDLENDFHYRNIDVSSIKETCRIYNPRVFASVPPKSDEHRALADCHSTLSEFRFYLENFIHVDGDDLTVGLAA